jgi:hypothetical protein
LGEQSLNPSFLPSLATHTMMTTLVFVPSSMLAWHYLTPLYHLRPIIRQALWLALIWWQRSRALLSSAPLHGPLGCDPVCPNGAPALQRCVA